MKVLMMTRLYWPHVGGVEKHMEKICDVLSKKHQITIVCEKHDPRLPDFEQRRGVAIYRIGGADKWTIWTWWFRHLNLINEADIIHIHDVFFWFLPFRLPYWFKKVYMTFHGYEGAGLPHLSGVFWHKLAAWMTRGNICVGDFHRKWYGVKPDFVSYGAA